MESIVEHVEAYFFPGKCSTIILHQGDYLNNHCLKQFASRLLGLLIIIGSLGVQLPQIIKIYASKSGKGLSPLSFGMQLTAVSTGLAYMITNHHPFSAYGDGMFVAAQLVTIIAMTLYYDGRSATALAFTASYAAVMAALIAPQTPKVVLSTLQAANIPVIVGGRLVQAYVNYKQQSTGQLSLITTLLIVVGCFARVFTTLQDSGDQLVLMVYAIAGTMNAIILAQIFYYANNSNKKKVDEKSDSGGVNENSKKLL